MEVLPVDWMTIIGVFALLFTTPVWHRVLVLLGGVILAPGKRTVTTVLQVIGLGARMPLSPVPSGVKPCLLAGISGQSTLTEGTTGGVGASGPGDDGAGRIPSSGGAVRRLRPKACIAIRYARGLWNTVR